MDSKESCIDAAENSAIISDFSTYSSRLDHCYDKYESIYKLNRDLTRESKKIICTLHRLPGCSAVEQESHLEGCAAQLTKLRDGIVTTIVSMLEGEPPHLHSPAHAAGIEEYLEALLFFSFLRGNFILNFEQVRNFMDGKSPLLFFFNCDSTAVPDHKVQETLLSPSTGEQGRPGEAAKLVSYDAYIMGLSDVSGELMRYFVKCAGIGEMDKSASVVRCLRQMSSGYGSLQAVASSLDNKIGVHRRNLAKVEEINYNLNLRRSEMPSDLASILLPPLEDDFA